ncbi:sulfurtransferase-like selenium metabolism protein YedF [Hathewaya massiliensis]|uniref:sulfurtransferase-like selenium metabolism protein YedF n=1 Tax=Hathewaya massiliensis TaxID=1964382 RepID=UPI0011589836|nr:sulfurtransferase-like selenium metabolism protein YedF [Hathewaya massiliensis]
MKKEIDCRGLNCPLPVVNTKKYFDSIEEGEATIIVDNEVAKNNLLKYASSNNFQGSAEEKEGLFYVEIGKTEGCSCNFEEENKKFTIAIGQDKLGNGDEKLGTILIKSYIFALSEASVIPTDMLFFNSGVKLTVEGSEVLDSLNKLKERGVNIQVCGTCLDFYEIKEKLQIGEISNMYSIVETMNTSDKIVNL